MPLRSFARSVGCHFLVGYCLLFTSLACGETAQLPKGIVFVTPHMPDNVVADMRAINEDLSRNVKPQENAVVWLLQALGEKCVGESFLESTLEMLGVQSFSREVVLEDLEAFALRKKMSWKNLAQALSKFEEGIRIGPTRLWKRDEFESLATYLDENTAALDLVTAGVRQPGYYWPLVSEEVPQRLMSASFGLELRLVFLAKLLSARANLRIEEGEIDLAMTDILTLHRMASLMSHGCPLEVTVSKAQLIDAFAFGNEKLLLESGKLTSESATRYREQLAAVPPVLTAAEAADRGERYVVRQEISLLRINPDELRLMFENPNEEPDPNGKPKPPKPIPKIDWKLAVQRGEELQDQVQKAMAEQDPQKQEELFAALDREYEQWDKNIDETTIKMIEDLEKKNDLAGASRYLGETMARAVKTNYRQRVASEFRTRSRRDMVTLGLALIAMQRDQGEFPESTEGLVPDYLKQIPLDPNTQESFVYSKESKDLARLISLGGNRRDDAGKFPSDDQVFELK